ncbi:MAG: Wzz/FepE/Etk N-terminal domain-containing protein [Ferruginibacter sp.]
MNSTALIKEILKRIKKFRIVVLIAGILFALLMLFYAKSKRTTYTSKATVFPLTSPSDKTISNNMLSGILGLGEAPKTFSEEATINIIELAFSRRIRESVAVTRLPEFENKTIAELLINDINENSSLFGDKIKQPKDSLQLALTGSEILKPNINAKMSKNGVLEIYYTGTMENLVTPVSNVLIDKLSKFYVDLKRQKAADDYRFTLDKIDSLQHMINSVDRDAIGMQKRTMFTPSELLEYAIPKENVSSEKSRVLRQRDMYINNRDEAVWRLQKVTPIIAVLDKPTAPFDVKKQPLVIYSLIGFIGGCIIGILVLVSGLLYKFVKDELYKSIVGKESPASA